MYQQRVRELYPQLSPAYRRIADFLMEHYREAAFMTAAQIGQATQADTTAVVRFARTAGVMQPRMGWDWRASRLRFPHRFEPSLAIDQEAQAQKGQNIAEIVLIEKTRDEHVRQQKQRVQLQQALAAVLLWNCR